MKLLDRLESWFGRFAIPHLTIALIALQATVYVVMWGNQVNDRINGARDVADNLALIPTKVLAGEWWRVLTFAVIPPFGSNLLFAFLGWYFFWLMGTALEREWGTFRYNVYLLIGYLATVGVSFALPAFWEQSASSIYWLGSIFLAFAYLYPDYMIYLFFILQIRVKWMALVTWLGYAATLAFGTWPMRLVVLAAVANFLLFFGQEIVRRVFRSHRHMVGQSAEVTVYGAPVGKPQKCRVCGITNRTHKHVDFRFCSKCQGDCCYCAEHLKTHEHVGAKV